ncbi:MAG: hypothetical protein E7652_01815 [Ruminococcaceae bacterium]|nr:hypothetical protein [Oscillospiraceae bacterium]
MGIERLKEFWPEWECGDILGKGSFGKVYKAVNHSSGVENHSAIKVISIPSDEAEYDALLSEGMSVSDTKEYFRDIVNDFINEIKVMVALKGAPNIVAVEDYKILESSERVGWDIFIRMELLHSFKELMAETELTKERIVKLGIDIASALEICQQKHIIHRDIKPANIFIDDFGNFKLGDFGIAKELEKTTGAASSKGTFSFMAPEVAHGQRYDNTVDIYSLGLVMYTLLNGNRAPFIPRDGRVTYNDRKNANDRRLAGEPLPKIEGVSQTLNDIILTACSYDPAIRFKSASAFKNALKSYNNAPKPPPAPTPFVPEQNIDETVAVARKPEPKLEIDATVAVAHKPEVKREENIEPVKTPKKKKGGIIAVAIILVVALLAVAIVPGMLDNGTKQTEANTEQTENETGVEEIIDNAKDQGTTGDVEWFYGDNTLVISGEGKMGDYGDDDIAPWTKYNKEIEEIVVEEGVTSIGGSAFYHCTGLTSVMIPDSVTSISDSAFYSCERMTNVAIPDSVTSIGGSAFSWCTGLTSVTIPDSVTSIGGSAFYHCTGLTSVTIPDSVTSIGDGAFYSCESLTSVTIPDSVTSIGDEVFSSCDSLTSVTIPDSVTSIGSFAFSHCDSLTSVTIPDSVTSIGGWAFYDCDSLTIECPSGSYAEQYAIEEGIPYTAI